MKIKFLVFLIIIMAFNGAYAQKVPVIGVMVFESGSSSVTAADTVNITGKIISELSSWGTLNIVQGSLGAEYIIRGAVARQGSSYILTGETLDAKTEKVLSEYREQVPVIGDASFFAFCARAAEEVPFPNYLLGTWQSSINMPDGPVVCIIEFRSDRSVRVERYDTWEHRANNSLRYEGYGRGAYSYAPFAYRMITVNSRQIRIDAAANINLKLEETLPEQTDVNRSGLSLLFNSEKTSFEIVNGSLPCGRNYDGPSVYPSDSIGFTQFTKIR